jgi:endo-1,3(4)-beta-glucanase
VVGMTPSFGSEEFNDHHFHYGYFLYAAAVLAANDPALAQRYAPVLNLLAAAIGSSANGGKGSSSETAHFPDRRTFDAYASHSWAVTATGGKFDQKFADYLLMYSALAGEQ